MQTSEKIDKLAIALSKAQAVMETADKSSTNPFFHSSYADLAEVWEACRKPLTDNGLSVIQSISSSQKNQFDMVLQTKEGPRKATGIWLVVTSRLLHISEQWIEDTIEMPVEADPQSIGKITTYIRRYALMALCGIAPEDDDGESAAGRDQRKLVDQTAHYCKEHKTKFFKSEKMKSYAHPIGNTGEWCYEHTSQPPESFKEGVEVGETIDNTTKQPATPEKGLSQTSGQSTKGQWDKIFDLWKAKGVEAKIAANYIRVTFKVDGKTPRELIQSLTTDQADTYIKSLDVLPNARLV